MDTHNPNIIVRLIALNERTRKAWADPHNKPYYIPASFQGFQVHDDASRESSPSEESTDGDSHVEDSEPELRIPFSSRPKNVGKGWIFGSDKSACDIYCGERDTLMKYNISSQTFSITISEQGNVVLTHMKDVGRTTVQYDSQKAGERRAFVWIMLPIASSILVTSAKQLKFKVIVATSVEQTELYNILRAEFLNDVMNSTTANTSLVSTPKTLPFYYRCIDQVLGRGSFGEVYVVIDVSTGFKYAGKTFFGHFDPNEVNILSKQNHCHILRYVGLSDDDGHLLVTEYIGGGNLARPWQVKDVPMWTEFQIFGILTQCLHGLASLHAEPNPVIHRDIKPQNILVTDDVICPFIKLADFGLAIKGTRCQGTVGTWLYTAPEVFFEREYDNKIDIWSLAVVVMQLLLEGRIPTPTSGYVQGPQWCKDIIRKAGLNYVSSFTDERNRLPEDKLSMRSWLWAFVVNHMLREDPKERLSAAECLGHVDYSEVFQCIPEIDSRSPTAAAEGERQNDSGQQPDGTPSASKVREKGDPASPTINMASLFGPSAFNSFLNLDSEALTAQQLPANPILSCPSARAASYFANVPLEESYYDQGIDIEEAFEVMKEINDKEANLAAGPALASKASHNNPQPLAFGLVHEDHHNDPASGSRNETPRGTQVITPRASSRHQR